MEVIPDISVVIPVYNNQEFLVELNKRILEKLQTHCLEIIYINDASLDDSILILQHLTVAHPEVKIIDCSTNFGQQKATLKGLKEARGKKIVVMDGDLQDAPELIPELYILAKKPGCTAYVLRKGFYQSKARMITSRLIKFTIYLLSGLHYKAGSYYMMDQNILPKVVAVASSCRHPYLSIIIAHFSKSINYISATRSKSIGPSGYSFMGRFIAASHAIYCSLFCSYIKLSRSKKKVA